MSHGGQSRRGGIRIIREPAYGPPVPRLRPARGIVAARTLARCCAVRLRGLRFAILASREDAGRFLV